jgi:hypothetical protein
LDERCSSIGPFAPVQVYNMLVTQFTTRTATSTYTTPPGGPGAMALANAAGLDLLGARMGFDVATQTYTLGLQLDWCVECQTRPDQTPCPALPCPTRPSWAGKPFPPVCAYIPSRSNAVVDLYGNCLNSPTPNTPITLFARTVFYVDYEPVASAGRRRRRQSESSKGLASMDAEVCAPTWCTR